eukprot:scaffold6747_cov70-Cylindrotheca_fusiformis.AAC.1
MASDPTAKNVTCTVACSCDNYFGDYTSRVGKQSILEQYSDRFSNITVNSNGFLDLGCFDSAFCATIDVIAAALDPSIEGAEYGNIYVLWDQKDRRVTATGDQRQQRPRRTAPTPIVSWEHDDALDESTTSSPYRINAQRETPATLNSLHRTYPGDTTALQVLVTTLKQLHYRSSPAVLATAQFESSPYLWKDFYESFQIDVNINGSLELVGNCVNDLGEKTRACAIINVASANLDPSMSTSGTTIWAMETSGSYIYSFEQVPFSEDGTEEPPSQQPFITAESGFVLGRYMFREGSSNRTFVSNILDETAGISYPVTGPEFNNIGESNTGRFPYSFCQMLLAPFITPSPSSIDDYSPPPTSTKDYERCA